jgi:hypothetical protein
MKEILKLVVYVSLNWRSVIGLVKSIANMIGYQSGMSTHELAIELKKAIDYFVATGDKKKLFQLLCRVQGSC